MWLTIGRNLVAHKVRLALTALAVVLGVAFVTGTLVLTDTMRGTFDGLTTDIYAGVDVAVQGPEEFGLGLTGETVRAPVDAALLDNIAAVDGVATVEGEVRGVAQLLDPDGQALAKRVPPLGMGAPVVPELSGIQLREGRYPTEPGEVAIDAATASKNELVVGDQVGVASGGPASSQTIVGIVGYGESDNLAGATLTVFDPDTAFELFAVDGAFRSINVSADEGVDREELVDRISAEIDGSWQVLTGEQVAASAAESLNENFGIVGQALLVFAGIALLVGSFIIFNTFSIIVAQRTRELALLRAVGASRRQVLTSVLLEALATGLVGSVVGIGLGIGVAKGLFALIDSFGIVLPEGDLVFATRTMIAGLLVGVVVTTLSALGPALRSLKVPPVAAMQAVAAPSVSRVGRGRTLAGAGVTLLGLLVLAVGLFSGASVPVIGLGALLVILGFTQLSAFVTRPILRVFSWPIDRSLGVRGELATQNALRNPRRTASTASALMIGLGLVSFVMIFGASLSSSLAAGSAASVAAEYQIRPDAGLIPAETIDAVAEVDGVAAVMPMQSLQFRYDEQVLSGSGIDPAIVDQVLITDSLEGELSALDADGFAVRDSIAEDEGWHVGDVVDIEFAETGIQQLELQAIVDTESDLSWYFNDDAVQANVREPMLSQVLVKLDDGVAGGQVRPALDAALADFSAVQLLDKAELQIEQDAQVDQILGLMTALLVLSVLIALFGLVNTLSLSVFERIRELGLLRAVGASRAQIRATVRWESVLIATLGATLGLGIGSLFGWMLVRALADQGFSRFSFPVPQLLAAFVIAGIAGVIAAILPARKAAGIDVLRALEMQ